METYKVHMRGVIIISNVYYARVVHVTAVI